MIKNLTKRTIDSLAPASNPRGERYYDSKLRGFGVQVYPSGRKVFFVEYQVLGHRNRRRWSFADYGKKTPEEAREDARQHLAAADRGEDPLDEREQQALMPTWSEWVTTYLARVEKRKRRPDTDLYFLKGVENVKGRRRIRRKREPQQCIAWERWHNRPLNSITTAEVAAGMAKMAERGRIIANRWLASVRACLQEASRDGLLRENVAHRVRPYRENPPRARVLSEAERDRFLAAVEELHDAHVRAAFKLLDQTGARLSEVLRARWEDLDLDEGLWRIPSPKSGYPQVLPLAGPTIALLRNLPRLGDYVVAGRFQNRPRTDLKSAWQDIAKAAQLEGVHIHDIRRSYGLRVTKARGLHMASKLLRHTGVRITERVYAPLGIEDLREATEHVAKVLPMTKAGEQA